MAIKVNIVLSPAQTDLLIKTLAAAPKQTKSIEALTAKITEAKTASEAQA